MPPEALAITARPPRILCIGEMQSTHAQNWMALLRDSGLELRAFTLPACATVSIAAAPGTMTTTWSGASGRSASEG